MCGGKERLDHPTQKPEWLIERLLDRHALLGMSVLDPFAGVGTVSLCCKRRGLSSAAIEIDPHYFDQARARLG